jgi:hypothetical protein
MWYMLFIYIGEKSGKKIANSAANDKLSARTPYIALML